MFENSLLNKKQTQDSKCARCSNKMYFGNDEYKLELAGHPNLASPHRIDDKNVFYDDNNYHLCCLACNYNGNHNIRRCIENPAVNVSVDLSVLLLNKCKENVKKLLRKNLINSSKLFYVSKLTNNLKMKKNDVSRWNKFFAHT